MRETFTNRCRPYNVDAEGPILGRGHPERDVLGWSVPVLWPGKLITLPARVPRPKLSGEVPITLCLLDDVEIPEFAPPRTRSQAEPLDNRQAEHASYKRPTRPIAERVPILYGLKQLANPFVGLKHYGNRRVEQVLDQQQ